MMLCRSMEKRATAADVEVYTRLMLAYPNGEIGSASQLEPHIAFIRRQSDSARLASLRTVMADQGQQAQQRLSAVCASTVQVSDVPPCYGKFD
jgi:hypothetical protein